MKKNKDFKQLSVSERMKMSESLGARVAIIVNKVREKANKILAPAGFEVNIQIDFIMIDLTVPKEEVNNG